jgi:hypothetical protein
MRDNALYADIAGLVAAIIVLLAFLALPLVGDFTAIRLLTLSDIANQLSDFASVDTGTPFWLTILYAIPLLMLVVAFVAAFSLGNRTWSHYAGWISTGAGGLALLVLLIYVIGFADSVDLATGGSGISEVLSNSGFGFWMMILGAAVLIGQVFVSRSDTGMVMTHMTAEAVVVQAAPAPPPPAPAPPPPPAKPKKQLANAWLIDPDENYYQLFQGETRIGRSRQHDNDIVIGHDSVSRQHALIREENGKFILTDISGRGTVYVNGQPLHGSHVLNHAEDIYLGPDGQVVLRFVNG